MLKVLGIFCRFFQILFAGVYVRSQIRRWIQDTLVLIAKLDEIEHVPLFWPLHHQIPKPLEDILAKVDNQLSQSVHLPTTNDLAQARLELKRRALALRYRLDHQRDQYSTAHFNILEKMALKWFEEHPLHFSDTIPHSIYEQLKIAACYPAFVDLLFSYSKLMAEFQTWTLQDRNPTEAFIEYPAMQTLLVESNLAGRLQRAYPAGLRILTSGNQKFLAMLFEGRYVNILEMDETVTLKGEWSLTIREIFDIFRSKTYGAGDLEFFTTGVTNWNAHRLATWKAVEKEYKPINVDMPHWWNELPILQVLSKTEARQRYGFAVDGKHWVAAATATRGTATLDYDQSHAFLEVAIPMRDGRYAIFDFGKFATVFPKNMFETLLLFANSVHATIAYPDENAYYTHRQHAQHAFALSPSEAHTLMEIIRKDILSGRSKNLVYQIESENCAKWVQTTLQGVLGIQAVPNMFIMPLIEAEPKGPVYGLFKLLRMMPSDLPSRILVKLHFPLGAWRGNWIEEGGKRVWKALNNHPFWHSGLVYLPAFLHKQRTTGLLPVINGGQTGVLLRKHHISTSQTESRIDSVCEDASSTKVETMAVTPVLTSRSGTYVHHPDVGQQIRFNLMHHLTGMDHFLILKTRMVAQRLTELLTVYFKGVLSPRAQKQMCYGEYNTANLRILN